MISMNFCGVMDCIISAHVTASWILRHRTDWTYCDELSLICRCILFMFIVFRSIKMFVLRSWGYELYLGTRAVTRGGIRYIWAANFLKNLPQLRSADGFKSLSDINQCLLGIFFGKKPPEMSQVPPKK